MAVKTSILVFYLTLTKGESVFRWANYITLFVVNAAGLALTLVNVFQCHPVGAAVSYPLPPDAQCTDILTLYLCSSPVNIITDLAILFLPIPILTQMRLPRKQKVIIVITFSFGFFVAVVDVIRIAYLQNAATSRQIALKELHLQDSYGNDLSCMYLQLHSVTLMDTNFAGYASLSFMWSVIEVNVSVMCACVPSLKPLVARIIPKLIRDTDEGTQNTADAHFPGSADLPVGVPPVMPGASQDSNANKSSQSASRSSGIEPQRNSGSPVDMLEFLHAPSVPRDAEANTVTSSYLGSITFFDFVNMKKPTSMLKLNNKESIAPIALTTILFFLWGFAYGLLDILNTQFQLIVRLDAWHSLALHAVYFGGYLVAPPLIGRVVLKRWGFKATFITGLCIYACGTLIFWPSAVLSSYSAFAVSNFIVGFGLAVLETAANPFIALCGPLENSEVRLNISQGVQAIGSVLSPLLAKKVLFKKVTDVSSLVDVQWTYLGISLFDVLLAVAFHYLPVPEASDDDLEELANNRREDNQTKVLGIPVVWLTLGLGVSSMFFYVAGQEVLSKSFEPFVKVAAPNSHLGSFEYLTLGHTMFAIGRFLAALAQLFLKPRWILLFSYIGMILFTILCMKTTGPPAVAMGLLVYLFESGAFSIIFSIALRGTARHTKTAAVLLTVAIGGGGLFTFAQHAARLDGGMFFSYGVLLALYCAGALFPIYLNICPVARKQVDPVRDEYLMRRRRRRRRNTDDVDANGNANDNSNGNDNNGTAVAHQNEKDITSNGGVLSRRRSAISLNSERHGSSANGNRRGGIMHELAPWPNTPAN